jgi:exodeoxyribonuclease VII large subunit
MAKPSKSQWDFGELFSPEQTRRVLSVSELTTQVKRLLEQHVGTVWVAGEITNFRRQSSGHCYFTLKDANTQLTCVLFRGADVSAVVRDALQDGQKVILQGEVTVYEARGQYQLLVRSVELQGIGALQAAFERLKQKLAAEGLFAAERKRTLPPFPQRIGLVTSPTGAAIRDVLHVIGRRNPGLEIILAPCRVQGQGAAEEIASAIADLNAWQQADGAELDLILVTRGGGSLEDLWAFNEEVVARAIAASAVPVVSAVGHEIDFTIADFVADLRAATPSAAAELITEGVFASRLFVAEAPDRLRQLCLSQLSARQDDLSALERRLALVHPRRRLEEWSQRVDDAADALLRNARHRLREEQLRAQNLAGRLQSVRPAQQLKQRADHLEQLATRLAELAQRRVTDEQTKLKRLQERLRLLGPEQVLARGYSITTDAATGQLVRSAEQVKPGQRVKTRLQHGEISSVVGE